MNRGLLMALLALDLLLMAASGYIVLDRVRLHFQTASVSPAPHPAPAAAPTAQPAAPPVQPAAVEPPSDESAAPEEPAPEQETPARRVLFKYRDAVPQRVSIIGDFNRWSPQLMKKDKNANWTVVFRLKPGTYAYNFVVDGKTIRDPSNRRMKPAGQKIPSSVLVVKP